MIRDTQEHLLFIASLEERLAKVNGETRADAWLYARLAAECVRQMAWASAQAYKHGFNECCGRISDNGEETSDELTLAPEGWTP